MPALYRGLVMVAVAIGLVVAGFQVGKMLRSKQGHNHQHPEEAPAFAIGDPFPDVRLTTEWGDTTTTHALLAGNDGVVLFLDPECPPCVDTARNWGIAIDAGSVDPNRVFAVVDNTGAEVAKFNAEIAPRLRVFMDRDKAFMKQHGLASYPLIVGITPTRQVRYVGEDPEADPVAVAGP